MKRKAFYAALLAAVVLAGCKEEELPVTDFETVKSLSAKAALVSHPDVWYPGAVDHEKGTVTFSVPYFLSDTEEIQGDLTKMKMKIAIPIGASFSPEVARKECDLLAGVTSKLTLKDKHVKNYTFRAEYVKSSENMVLSATNEQKTRFNITPPAEGRPGELVYLRSAVQYTEEIAAVTVTVSPWAVIQGACYDAGTGLCDFNKGTDFKVVAQDGTASDWKFVVKDPEYVPEGQIGRIYSLFGFQTTAEHPHGFTIHNNRSIAVIDNLLVLSNSSKEGDADRAFPVYDRFTGEKKDILVSREGIDEKFGIHSVCNDDANHLVAVTFVMFNNKWGTEYKDFKVYVWKNGLTSAPQEVMSENVVDGDAFSDFRAAGGLVGIDKNPGEFFDVGRYIAVKGDMTKGDAVLAIGSKQIRVAGLVKFTDGKRTGKVQAVLVPETWENTSKVLPLRSDGTFSFLWTGAENLNHQWVKYYSSATESIEFQLPGEDFWFNSSIYGIGCTEFNGCRLIGLAAVKNIGEAIRLYVANIGTQPVATSLIDGFLFDSYKGGGQGELPGSGYCPTGLLSLYPFVKGETILGPNGNGTGDVAFGRSADGSAVQVYLLGTNKGMLAYEITRFKP